jgi:HK97 gp10 family phage protein
MARKGVSVELQGIDVAVRALQRIEFKARRRIVQAAVREGLKVLRTEARATAPVRGGALKKSINSSVKMERATGTVRGSVNAGKSSKAQKRKGMNAWYAPIVSRGAKPHRIPKAGGKPMRTPLGVYSVVQHTGAPGNPFMQYAADRKHRQALAAFRKRFGEKVEEEARKQWQLG